MRIRFCCKINTGFGVVIVVVAVVVVKPFEDCCWFWIPRVVVNFATKPNWLLGVAATCEIRWLPRCCCCFNKLALFTFPSAPSSSR